MNNKLYYFEQNWNCDECNVTDDCFGNNLTAEQKKLILSNIKCHRYFQPGEKIFQIENEFKYFYIIKKGLVKLQEITQDGDKYIKRFCFPNDIIGMDSIGNEYYLNDAIALEKTNVCIIPYEKLEKECLKSPYLLKDLIKRLVSEIHLNDASAFNINSSQSLDQRLLVFLNLIAKRIGKKQHDNVIEMDLPMSKKDISTYLGARPESLSRAFEKLKLKNLVHCHGRAVQLINAHNESNDSIHQIKN